MLPRQMGFQWWHKASPKEKALGCSPCIETEKLVLEVSQGCFEVCLLHEMESGSYDWLHVTGKGDDNMIYERQCSVTYIANDTSWQITQDSCVAAFPKIIMKS